MINLHISRKEITELLFLSLGQLKVYGAQNQPNKHELTACLFSPVQIIFYFSAMPLSILPFATYHSSGSPFRCFCIDSDENPFMNCKCPWNIPVIVVYRRALKATATKKSDCSCILLFSHPFFPSIYRCCDSIIELQLNYEYGF